MLRKTGFYPQGTAQQLAGSGQGERKETSKGRGERYRPSFRNTHQVVYYSHDVHLISDTLRLCVFLPSCCVLQPLCLLIVLFL